MNWLKGFDGPITVLLLLMLAVAVSFWRAQKNPTFAFDIFDLIMENGRLSRIACVFCGSFAMTTWMMVRLSIDGKMSENYFMAYCAAWVAPVVAKLFSPPPVPGTTTLSTTSSKTVELTP